jgi:hypothetical protein
MRELPQPFEPALYPWSNDRHRQAPRLRTERRLDAGLPSGQRIGLAVCPKRRVERQQFAELRRSVADIVRPDDENVPSLFQERLSFGDGDDHAQAHGDRNIAAS